jgi:hypothetical protein
MALDPSRRARSSVTNGTPNCWAESVQNLYRPYRFADTPKQHCPQFRRRTATFPAGW